MLMLLDMKMLSDAAGSYIYMYTHSCYHSLLRRKRQVNTYNVLVFAMLHVGSDSYSDTTFEMLI